MTSATAFEPRVGDVVAVACFDKWAMSLHRATVTKVGKRDLVLNSGERFPVRSLARHSDSWGPTEYIVPVDDPRLPELRQEIRGQRALRAAMHAAEAWMNGAGVGHDPIPVVKAFAALLPADKRDAVLNAIGAES
jgi:hypothetical protein